jgi:outer membrane protein assembly factor BamB
MMDPSFVIQKQKCPSGKIRVFSPFFLFLTLIGVTLLFVAIPAGATDDPFYSAAGRYIPNEAVSGSRISQTPQNVAPVWTYNTGGGVFSSPAIADGVVYIGSDDKNMYAINLSTGQLKWGFPTGDAVASSPFIADNVVYIGSYDGNVYALDANSGHEKWRFSTRSTPGKNIIQSKAAVANGVVYIGNIGSSDGSFYAIDAGTGLQKWKFTTNEGFVSAPQVVNNVVYVGSYDHNVYAINAETGQKIWNFTTGDAVSSSPAVANGIVYIGSLDHKLHAINADNGHEVWNFPTGDWVLSSPAVANGVVYVGSNDHNLYAVDAANGRKLWQYTTMGNVWSSPVVVNNVVYVGSEDRNLYAIDATNGQKLWQYTTGFWVLSSPATADGVIVVGSIDHKVYAFAPLHSNFTATPTSGQMPLSVQFTDTSAGHPTGWAWFFGDESYSQAWTLQTPSAEWPGRGAYPAVVMPDNSIVLIGGYDLDHYMNDVWRSTDVGKTWTQQTPSAAWSPRTGHTSVVMPDGSIVLMGGWDIHGIDINDVWISTDVGKTWTQQTPSAAWSPRAYHTSIVLPDGGIVLMGGRGDDEKDYRNDVWKSTDSGKTWTQQTPSAAWLPRAYHTSVVLPDGGIVLMGGRNGQGGPHKNDVWRSTDSGKTWIQQTPSAAWSPRFEHSSVVMPDGSIVLMGGWDINGTRKNDVWMSTDAGKTWTQRNANAEWSPRAYHGSVVMPDGSIVLIAGYDNNVTKNDVWRMSPVGSSVQNPMHTYTQPGTYSVALQASNANGYSSDRKTGYITVKPKPPVIDWQKSFGGSKDEYSDFILRTPTNTIVIAGETESADGDINATGFHGLSDIVVANLDQSGNIIWKHAYGGHDGASSVRQILELPEGFLLIGSTQATTDDFNNSGHHGHHGIDDIALVMVDKTTGAVLWSRCYGGTENDVALWGTLSSDESSVVLTGYTNSNDGDFLNCNKGSDDAFALKINLATKNATLARCYGGSKHDQGSQIEKSPDSLGYYIAGYTASNDLDVANRNHGGDAGTSDAWLFFVDEQLNFVPEKSRVYGGQNSEELWGMQVTGDGTIIVIGNTDSLSGDGDIPREKHGNLDSDDIWFMKLNPANGSPLINRCYGGSRNDLGVSVREIPLEGFFIMGSTSSSDGDVTFNHGGDSGTSDLWLIKADLQGNIIYQQTYGGSDNDYGKRFGTQNSPQAMQDGYIIGTTNSTDGQVSGNHGMGDIWVIKLKKATAGETLW